MIVVLTNSTIHSLEAVSSGGGGSTALFAGLTVNANAYLTISFGGSAPSLSALTLYAPCGLSGGDGAGGGGATAIAATTVQSSTIFYMASAAAISISRLVIPYPTLCCVLVWLFA